MNTHHHLTHFSPIGARLRAAERARGKHIGRVISEIIACILVGALFVAVPILLTGCFHFHV